MPGAVRCPGTLDYQQQDRFSGSILNSVDAVLFSVDTSSTVPKTTCKKHGRCGAVRHQGRHQLGSEPGG